MVRYTGNDNNGLILGVRNGRSIVVHRHDGKFAGVTIIKEDADIDRLLAEFKLPDCWDLTDGNIVDFIPEDIRADYI